MMMTREMIAEAYPDILLADGLDEAFIGVCRRFGAQPIACYDRWKCIEIFMSWDMTHEDAVEFFEHNQIGASVGPLTPCYIELLDPDDPPRDQPAASDAWRIAQPSSDEPDGIRPSSHAIRLIPVDSFRV